MAMDAGEAVVREIRIDASPETVFELLTDAEKIVLWKGRAATLDPRPGGTYLVDVSGENVARGRYVEVVPNRRVVFTWGWEGDAHVPPGSSTVEITLEPDGAGTVLRLVHSGLPSAEARAEHARGWDHFLERLAIVAAGGDPGPDHGSMPTKR